MYIPGWASSVLHPYTVFSMMWTSSISKQDQNYVPWIHLMLFLTYTVGIRVKDHQRKKIAYIGGWCNMHVVVILEHLYGHQSQISMLLYVILGRLCWLFKQLLGVQPFCCFLTASYLTLRRPTSSVCSNLWASNISNNTECTFVGYSLMHTLGSVWTTIPYFEQNLHIGCNVHTIYI